MRTLLVIIFQMLWLMSWTVLYVPSMWDGWTINTEWVLKKGNVSVGKTDTGCQKSNKPEVLVVSLVIHYLQRKNSHTWECADGQFKQTEPWFSHLWVSMLYFPFCVKEIKPGKICFWCHFQNFSYRPGSLDYIFWAFWIFRLKLVSPI